MEEFARHVLMSLKSNSVYVYLFIFFVAFSESFAFLGLIVPGAAIVVTAGFLASKGYFSIYWLIAYAILGAIFADIASFIIGEKYHRHIKKTKIYKKYEQYFLKGEIFFKKHGAISIFLGRFIGFLRPVIPFVAGMMKMNRLTFLIWAVISGILWGIAYIGFGYYSGKGIELLKRFNINANYITVGIILLFIIAYFIKNSTAKKT